MVDDVDFGDEILDLGERITMRRWTDYNKLAWSEMNFSGHFVELGVFAGPVAVVRDPRNFARYQSTPLVGDDLVIFSLSGMELRRLSLASVLGSNRVAGMGWTRSEHLVVVLSNGSCALFTPKGPRPSPMESEAEAKARSAREPLSRFRLFSNEDRSVVSVCISGSTLAAIWRKGEEFGLSVVYDVEVSEPRGIDLPTGIDGLRAPTCVAVLETPGAPGVRGSRPEVLLGTQDASLVVVGGGGEAEDQLLNGTVLTEVLRVLVPSPSGRLLAAMDEGGALLVLPSSLDRVHLRFEPRQDRAPTQVSWVGDDCVALAYSKRGVLLVGPTGDFLDIPFPGEELVLATEMDGVRVLTPERLEGLQRLPAAVAAARAPGSRAPAAALLRALRRFSRREAGSESVLRELAGKGELSEAVATLLAAAPEERTVAGQQELLRAASMGLHASERPDADAFVSACRAIRVLNRVRQPAAGMPLSARQYGALAAEALAQRLAQRHQYEIALQLCEFLGLRTARDAVLVHWARAKVTAGSTTEDKQVLHDVKERLRNVRGVSFADIASAADAVGRRELATQFLLAEKREDRTVLLWLKMRQGELALYTALRHGPTDLVHAVLAQLEAAMVDAGVSDFAGDARALSHSSDGAPHLHALSAARTDPSSLDPSVTPPSETSLRAFYCLLGRYERATAVYESYLRQRGTEQAERRLMDFWLALGRVEDVAMFLIERAADEPDQGERKRLLADAGTLVRAAAERGGTRAGSDVAKERFGRIPPGWPDGGKPLGEGPEADVIGSHPKESDDAASAAASGLDLPPVHFIARPYETSTGSRDNLLFLASSLEASATLVRRQAAIARKLHLPGLGGATLAETLEACAVVSTMPSSHAKDASKLAESLVGELKVPAERWWYARIQAMGEKGKWSDLEALAKTTRSPPVGWKPFIDACLDHTPPNAVEARKYIVKLATPEERVEAFLKACLFPDAVDTAAAARDEMALRDIIGTIVRSGDTSPEANAAKRAAREALAEI